MSQFLQRPGSSCNSSKSQNTKIPEYQRNVAPPLRYLQQRDADFIRTKRVNMEQFLREWRQDALNKSQYESAIFIGDKLLALTGADDDAFWLAQVHFARGNYTRAQSFLSNQDLVVRNSACRYLAGHCFIKQGRFEEALSVLGERNPTHMISTNGAPNASKRKVQPGGNNRSTMATRKRGATGAHDGQQSGDASVRRYEAGMCFLRGICYAKQNAFDRARECYKDAVRIDVQCFEAFQQLVKNSLLSPDEEWQFLESLDFDSIAVAADPASSQEASEFTKMLYTTRLSKYRNPAAFDTAYDSLSTHYRLSANPDLLLARADLLYTQCRHRDALAVTTAILQDDKYNFAVYPLHLACLFELRMKNQLFLVAHDLADTHPEEPCTWLAVGTYYFLADKIAEARRYFSKASMMDTHFGPAWIGFAHTFAAEGEHDQAISAYSTAARLFMGTHLPQVFLGMQNHALNNMTLAEEFLKTAYGLCRTDPLLLNEMGVVKYHQDRPQEAATFFAGALRVADEIDSEPQAWLAARTNLGHALRRMGEFDQALDEFDEVLRQGGKDAAVFCAKGLVFMELGRPADAVLVLHEALAIVPQDSVALELLNKALEETAAMDSPSNGVDAGRIWLDAVSGVENDALHADEEMAEFERDLDRKKVEARAKVNGTPTATTMPTNGTDPKGKGKGKARSRGRKGVLAEEGRMEATDDD